MTRALGPWAWDGLAMIGAILAGSAVHWLLAPGSAGKLVLGVAQLIIGVAMVVWSWRQIRGVGRSSRDPGSRR